LPIGVGDRRIHWDSHALLRQYITDTARKGINSCIFYLICNILPIFFIFQIFNVILNEISNILPMTMKELGKSIKFRRDFLKLRQEDLAEMSGIAIKTIHLIESGSGNPSVDTLRKIATVLGLELSLQIKKTN
jgi:DNA-binding XRE family transcriptional regulator